MCQCLKAAGKKKERHLVTLNKVKDHIHTLLHGYLTIDDYLSALMKLLDPSKKYVNWGEDIKRRNQYLNKRQNQGTRSIYKKGGGYFKRI